LPKKPKKRPKTEKETTRPTAKEEKRGLREIKREEREAEQVETPASNPKRKNTGGKVAELTVTEEKIDEPENKYIRKAKPTAIKNDLGDSLVLGAQQES